MKTSLKWSLIAAALGAGGCATLSPEAERQLLEARASYRFASEDPRVQRYAAAELASDVRRSHHSLYCAAASVRNHSRRAARGRPHSRSSANGAWLRMGLASAMINPRGGIILAPY